MLRITLATLHLLALPLGLGAVLFRAASLKEPATAQSLRRALRADTDWGIAAALWIVTGLWRYLGSVEKTTAYYNGNHAFLAKMALLALILLLEIWPMVTLIRWRVALGRGGSVETVAVPATARRIALISNVQALLVVLMVVLATMMARGIMG
jgi:putative membrane protein